MTNIPIYRAKKIDSDEWVEGYYIKTPSFNVMYDDFGYTKDIDPNTLAIHFPNMIDKNGKKIFASLSEDGIGGDRLNIHLFTLELGENMGVAEGEKEFNATAIFNEYGLGVLSENKREFLVCYAGLHEESVEVIGIYKGD